jgi:hypothetical protein
MASGLEGGGRGTWNADAAPPGVVAGKGAAGSVERDAIRTPWRPRALLKLG